MKLVWSPERASNAYIDTVKSCKLYRQSGVAEMVSAMAAGWNAQVIVETWSQGGLIATSVGLAIARRHTGGRHVCIVPDERSRSEYAASMGEAGMLPEIMVGEPEEVMAELTGILPSPDFPRVLRLAKLSNNGAVLLCKNTGFSLSSVKWRNLLGGHGSSRGVVRSVFLPVGKGLDMAHVSSSATTGGTSVNSQSAVRGNNGKRWIKHVDQRSGDVHYIRT
ncbi:uncharacterized protein LOC107643015 [Arachis ipaensis]|uniref:uncharacterized protein LOC107643015 n=1 Tax=Arachis ipaensis TaxID=130454 RepID=UPI000A2B7FF1|nr:uncharacterized protein LOC107643015 [Arachis ipaensis]